MPTRRTTLRRGAGVLGVGSLAVISVRTKNSKPGITTDMASILVAGSLQQIANQIGDVSVEAHGSVACRRLLKDGMRNPDAVALADPRLFSGITTHVTCFATNALVIAVNPDSPAATYADCTAGDEWRALLADSEVSLGRTDPRRDPLGYRTVMALRLAKEINTDAILARTTIHPETGLLRTLEAGGVDAAFAYRNMAVEHDLPSLTLPDRINFSSPALINQYAKATFDLDSGTVTGSPIRYAASARTGRGRQWIQKISNSTRPLRNAGFEVPDVYPTRRRVQAHL